MRPVARLDRAQRRHRSLAVPVAVVYKYLDDHGAHLTALLTYYGFVSIFPLLLLASTVLGLVLAGQPELQARVLGSAMEQLPVIGGDLGRPEQLGGGAAGAVLGLLLALYGGLGVARALQNASDTAWAVPRHQRPNPVVGRVRGLPLMAVIGVDVLATTTVAGLVGRLGLLGPLSGTAVVAATWALHAAAFAFVLRLSAARPLTWRQVAPGALVAGLLWTGLQYGGVTLVRSYAASSSVTNDVFAVVLGLLAFLYAQSVVIVLCIELNVVLEQRLYPRSLLSPFSADAPLTGADERSYEELAKAQQLQGSQVITVEFPEEPRDPVAR